MVTYRQGLTNTFTFHCACIKGKYPLCLIFMKILCIMPLFNNMVKVEELVSFVFIEWKIINEPEM